MTKHIVEHEQWSSNLGFILAATGAAVGLGNIWKFPYMAGSNGGSAFVFVYLICVLTMGIPIMIAEILIGRRGKSDPIISIHRLSEESNAKKYWRFIGWWGALGLILVLSFYCVVSGWSVAYVFKAVSGTFNHANAIQVKSIWNHFLSSPVQMLAWQTIFISMTMFVVAKGVEKGLERAGKVMLPLLFLILILLVASASFSPGFNQAVHFLFSPDFSKMTPSVIISAMGHAFFTLAVGVGAMLVYGSYVQKRVSIGKSVLVIVGLDVLVAIFSGLAIFPLVFSHHLSPSSGPGLMFVTLPITFSQIPEGQYIGALFFLLLLFAAWTSSINMAEPLVVILMKHWNFTRRKACIVVGSIAWLIGIGSVLSFNVWKSWKFAGQWTVFDLATDIPTNIIQPLGGLGFAIFAGWILKQQITKDELAMHCHWLYQLWHFLIRYVAPVGILIVFITSVI